MKFLAVLAAVLFTQIVGASTCFDLQGDRYWYLPKEICYESLSLNLESSILYIFDDRGVLPPMVPAKNVFRKNEDFFRFESSIVLFNKWESGCGDGLFGKLNLKGQADNFGSVEPESLSLELSYEVTNDTCHSEPFNGVALYRLRK